MSNRHLFMPAGYPIAPLKNGVGRYICQLKRITIKFCKSYGSSQGVRQFIESELLDFAKTNPGVVVYLKPRRHRAPAIIAEYLNGERHYVSCNCLSKEEIFKTVNLLFTRSGLPVMRYRKLQHTMNPTIQGIWSPFTNRDPALNLCTFPLEKSGPPNQPISATEQLLEMFKRQQLDSGESTTEDETKPQETSSASSI